MAEIVVQDCGCVGIPEDVAGALGMVPGARLTMDLDVRERRITLTAPVDARSGEAPLMAACPVKL